MRSLFLTAAVLLLAACSTEEAAFTETNRCDDTKPYCTEGKIPMEGILWNCARFLDEENRLVKIYCFPAKQPVKKESKSEKPRQKSTLNT